MPRTIPAIDDHQARLLARADRSAHAAEAGVRGVWLDLLRLMRAGGPWGHVYSEAARILRQLPAVAHLVAADLVRAHRDSATWTAEKLAVTLPRTARLHLLRRRGLIEGVEDEMSRLLVGVLLPPLDEQTVLGAIYRAGWAQSFQALTALAAPESLASRIASGVSQGLSVQRIARDIRPVVQGVQASARRVARTAGLGVAHEAERDVYRGLEGDLIAGYTVRAVLDARTRPAHRERDGHQFFCRPAPGQRGMNECPHPPREADGSWAFNCLLPGTVVQGVFEVALKSKYTGQVIEIRTRGGRTLRVTANHPVCTTAGFLPASQIREGFRLIGYSREVGGGLMMGVLEEQQPPTRVDQVFGAAKKLRPSRIERGSALDLHGDAQFGDRNIEVVALGRELRHHNEAAVREQLGQFGFVSPNVRLDGGPRFRPFGFDLLGINLPTSRFMSGSGLRRPLVGIHSGPLHPLRLGAASQLDARREQYPAQPARRLAGVTEVTPTDAEFARELLQRFPGVVSPDHVVEVRQFDWSGHVYDLQSPGGWIVADELFVSNCRCWIEPILSVG